MTFILLFLGAFNWLLGDAGAHGSAKDLQPVTYIKTVDGDTLKVRKNGKEITLRLLLTDTPESVKPGTPVQPFAKDAKNFTEKLAKQGNLKIKYDKGEKTDKYGRHLVYLYSGKKMINQELIRNGYARVGYVYSQKMFLKDLEGSQNLARKDHLRIWSIPGYVNTKGEGFLDKPKTTSENISDYVKEKVKEKAKKESKRFIKSIFN